MNHQVNYESLAAQLAALTDGIPYEIANLSNASALLWKTLPDINWAGFYKMVDGALVLYPFHGKPACIRIPVGRGVCGTAVAEDRTLMPLHIQANHALVDGYHVSEFYRIFQELADQL